MNFSWINANFSNFPRDFRCIFVHLTGKHRHFRDFSVYFKSISSGGNSSMTWLGIIFKFFGFPRGNWFLYPKSIPPENHQNLNSPDKKPVEIWLEKAFPRGNTFLAIPPEKSRGNAFPQIKSKSVPCANEFRHFGNPLKTNVFSWLLHDKAKNTRV